MNAPMLSRRGFTKAIGGLVVAFSLDPAEVLAQGADKPVDVYLGSAGWVGKEDERHMKDINHALNRHLRKASHRRANADGG